MSPTAYVRRGGAWVPMGKSGKARLGGVDIPFTGGGAPVDEFFIWPSILSSQDWADSNTNVGVKFGTTAPGSWIGNRVWVPLTPSPDLSVWGANDDLHTLVAPATTMTGVTQGAYNTQLFSSPVAIVPGVNYMAMFHTSQYGFSRVVDGAVTPFTTSRLFTDSTMVGTAFFIFGTAGANLTFNPSPNFHYHVSPVVRYAS